jgi:hypothetical protein
MQMEFTVKRLSTKEAIYGYLKKNYNSLLKFWIDEGADLPDVSLQDHCDFLYILFLIGDLKKISKYSAYRYAECVASMKLPGFKAPSKNRPIVSVHNFAYILGSAKLLHLQGIDIFDHLWVSHQIDLSELVDTKTCLPRFPRKFAHHSWRASHWLGGVPSILLSLAKTGCFSSSNLDDLARDVLDRVNAKLVDPSTGFIRAYQSDTVQSIFRLLYGLRHNPDIGDLGGIAHIVWVNHVYGVPYINARALLEAAVLQFDNRRPFMEKVPYCLDFDVAQIVRTASAQLGIDDGRYAERSRILMSDIDNFIQKTNWKNYSLHKIPGAMATYHECAHMAGLEHLDQFEVDVLDIIKIANWL